MRMRTIDKAAAYIRELDPDSALTKTAIRRLVTTGALPSITAGNKYLISLEALEDFLVGGGVSGVPQDRTSGGTIRRIDA